MPVQTAPQPDFLTSEAYAIASACTACGKCVEVCPVVPHIDMAAASAAEVAQDVVAFLKHRAPLSDASAGWTHACNGCGECIPVCPEGVNPRKMLVLANAMRNTVETETPQLFRKMSRAIRLMAGMQLLPDEFIRLFNPTPQRDVPVVFYLGCNALRTPHLLFNAMYILDALGTDYAVAGGPGACCGIIHSKWQGELAGGQRITDNTLSRFEGYRPDKVLTWCPSCQLHLGETLAGYRSTSFSLDHVTTYLAQHLEELRRKFIRPLGCRAILHAHTGLKDLGCNVARLLGAIPGLELIDTIFESGYTCGGSGCNKAPKLQAIEHKALLDNVRDRRADLLVTFYHGCHAYFMAAEKENRFKVLNFTDLVVEALGGTPHDDKLKHYRLLDDWKMVVEEGEAYLRANGIYVERAMLERVLPEIFALAEFRGGLNCFASPT